MSDVRMTRQTLAIVRAILDDPDRPWYGFELMQTAGIKSGTLYPALARLERGGWLESAWENVNPREEGRPRRRLYTLTGIGQRAATAALEQHFKQLNAAGWRRRAKPSLLPGGSVA